MSDYLRFSSLLVATALALGSTFEGSVVAQDNWLRLSRLPSGEQYPTFLRWGVTGWIQPPDEQPRVWIEDPTSGWLEDESFVSFDLAAGRGSVSHDGTTVTGYVNGWASARPTPEHPNGDCSGTAAAWRSFIQWESTNPDNIFQVTSGLNCRARGKYAVTTPINEPAFKLSGDISMVVVGDASWTGIQEHLAQVTGPGINQFWCKSRNGFISYAMDIWTEHNYNYQLVQEETTGYEWDSGARWVNQHYGGDIQFFATAYASAGGGEMVLSPGVTGADSGGFKAVAEYYYHVHDLP